MPATTMRFPDPEYFHRTHVLVEYDGPRLVFFESGGARTTLHLGTYIDGPATESRWLVVRVSKVEMEALARGILPMRAAFEKTQRAIVTFGTNFRPKHVSEAGDGSFPSDVLPVASRPLPRGARSLLVTKFKLQKEPPVRVRFDGRRVEKSTIEFAALARAAGALQGVWTAIGDHLGIASVSETGSPPPSALVADASLQPGSVAISLRPVDAGAFDAILREYEKMIGSLYAEETDTFLDGLGDELRRKLSGYMGALADFELDLFFESPSRAAFTGHSRAAVLRPLLKPFKQPPPKKERPEPFETSKRGHFESVDLTTRRFTFLEIDSGELLEGRISAALAKRMQGDGIVVGGPMTQYIVLLRSNTRGLTLKEFKPIQTTLF